MASHASIHKQGPLRVSVTTKRRQLEAASLTSRRTPSSSSRSSSSSRIRMIAAAAASPVTPDPPGMWNSIAETMESAAREADAIRQSVSSQVQEAVDTSVEALRATTADLPETLQRLSSSVQDRVEEATFESSRELLRLNAKYKISDKLDKAVGEARLIVDDIDCQYQVRQKLRQLQWEVLYYFSIFLKSFHVFRRSVVFPYAAGAVLMWLLLTGVLGHLFVCTLWTLPLVPVIARAVAKFALIEGQCSSCGHRFMGPRKKKLCCRQCNAEVWRPRGKSGSAPGSEEEKRPQPLVVVDITPSGSTA